MNIQQYKHIYIGMYVYTYVYISLHVCILIGFCQSLFE